MPEGFLAYRDLLSGDAEIGIDDEFLRAQGHRLLELGGKEDADSGQQLELGLPNGQET